MSKFISSLLTKLYWPTIAFFVIALLVYIISFFYTIEKSSAGNYYDIRSLKMIVIVAAIISSSVYMKYQDKTQIAHLVIYIPMALVIISMIFFFVIAYMLGS